VTRAVSRQNYYQMQINNRGNFKKAPRELQRMLAEQELRLQVCVRENEKMMRALPLIKSSVDFQDLIFEPITLKQIAIVNGKLLSPDKMKHLKIDNYDVVMNCTEHKLLARKDPDRRTKLEECNCTGIGRDRLKLLRCWLENPRLQVCEETIPRIFGYVASMTPGAIAKAIRDLRRCFWDAPYIITESDWGESISYTGSIYLLNDKYRYLVIRYKI